MCTGVEMMVVALSICASAVGVSVALMYGVRNRFPLYALMASAQDNRTTGYDVTPAIGSDDGGGAVSYTHLTLPTTPYV